METNIVELAEAGDRLPELLALAQGGTEVIIAVAGRQLARLVPLDSSGRRKRIAGLNRGQIWVSDDFNAPLPAGYWSDAGDPSPGDAERSAAMQATGADPTATPEPFVFWRYIASSLDRLVALCAGLTEGELDWRPPAPETNSLRALALHTLGNAEENLLGVLGGAAVGRDRAGEFAARGGPGATIAERWAALRPRLAALLDELTQDALDTAYPHPRRGAISGREILIVVARHAAEHLGQAELTRDLLRAARERVA